jgi:hypothetical protein
VKDRTSPQADSFVFAAGQQAERDRILALHHQRISDLNDLAKAGLPAHTVRTLTSEVNVLIAAIERSGQG